MTAAALAANQAARKWLESPDETVSYLAQLGEWALDKGGAQVPRPRSASQPERHDLEAVMAMLQGASPVAATEWFLSDDSLTASEQARSLAQKLTNATSPEEAGQIVIQTAYDVMVAASASSPA